MPSPLRNIPELHAEIPEPIHLDDPDWHLRGECRGMDPDIWHPGRGEDTSQAKAICHRCEVRLQCVAYALWEYVDVGIWGGRSERERREMRREMTRRGMIAIRQ